MNARSILRSKSFAIVSAGVLGAGLLGGVAFAAVPTTSNVGASALSDTQAASAQQEKRDSKLKSALDALVAKGVITQAQEDAIIAAINGERADHPKLKEFVGDVAKASVDYLGLPADQVKKDLRSGKILGKIAKEQATELRTKVDEAIVRIVDRDGHGKRTN